MAPHSNATIAKVEARRARALEVVKVGVVNGESKPKSGFRLIIFDLPFSFVAFNKKPPTLGAVASLQSTSKHAHRYVAVVLNLLFEIRP